MEWPGHEAAWRQWRAAFASERMHHAWLLAGMAGLGKRDFALAAARELVTHDSDGNQPLDHPDILTLQKAPKDDKEARKKDEGKDYQTKRNIAVSQIRAMQTRLTTRPTLGSRRVIIIDPADDMETSASNALLKSLEEPPQGTFFILIAHRPARLLPTIRSRCRIMRFAPLDRTQIEEALHASGERPDEAAIKAARGSPGAALRFARQDLAPIGNLMAKLIARGDADLSGRGELARLIGPRADQERMQAVFDLAEALLAQEARKAADPQRFGPLIKAHGELVTLARQAPAYNFDAGLLALQIGTLLASASAGSEQSNDAA